MAGVGQGGAACTESTSAVATPCWLQGKKAELQKMYEEWPFFAATIDLIEMILAKADMRISGLYDDVLVDDPQGKKLGSELRQKFTDTVRAICEVSSRAEGVAGKHEVWKGMTRCTM